jgi:1-aminocyclopropane-1-carboxylate synthase
MHDILAWSVGDPGDGILTSRPAYGRLELDFGNKSQLKVIYAETDVGTCFDVDVIGKYEAALEQSNVAGFKIRAIFIINPHNPLGQY